MQTFEFKVTHIHLTSTSIHLSSEAMLEALRR